MTTRHVGERNLKYIFWFVSCVDEDQVDIEAQSGDTASDSVPEQATTKCARSRTTWPRDENGEVKRVEGTQMDSERFDSQWVSKVNLLLICDLTTFIHPFSFR
jgi:hypothetical protein